MPAHPVFSICVKLGNSDTTVEYEIQNCNYGFDSSQPARKCLSGKVVPHRRNHSVNFHRQTKSNEWGGLMNV